MIPFGGERSRARYTERGEFRPRLSEEEKAKIVLYPKGDISNCNSYSNSGPIDIGALLTDNETKLSEQPIEFFIKLLKEGVKFDNAIKVKKAMNSDFVTYYSFRISLSNDAKPNELTKTRFLAMFHRYIHKAMHTRGDPRFATPLPLSALVARVQLAPGKALYDYRYLLGAGLQFQKSEFSSLAEFLTACCLMDYLACSNRKDDPFYGSLLEYLMSDNARRGNMYIAGLRKCQQYTEVEDNVWSSIIEFGKQIEVRAPGSGASHKARLAYKFIREAAGREMLLGELNTS